MHVVHVYMLAYVLITTDIMVAVLTWSLFCHYCFVQKKTCCYTTFFKHNILENIVPFHCASRKRNKPKIMELLLILNNTERR